MNGVSKAMDRSSTLNASQIDRQNSDGGYPLPPRELTIDHSDDQTVMVTCVGCARSFRADLEVTNTDGLCPNCQNDLLDSSIGDPQGSGSRRARGEQPERDGEGSPIDDGSSNASSSAKADADVCALIPRAAADAEFPCSGSIPCDRLAVRAGGDITCGVSSLFPRGGEAFPVCGGDVSLSGASLVSAPDDVDSSGALDLQPGGSR